MREPLSESPPLIVILVRKKQLTIGQPEAFQFQVKQGRVLVDVVGEIRDVHSSIL